VATAFSVELIAERSGLGRAMLRRSATEYAERDAPANEEEQHGRLHAVDRLLVDVKLVSEVGHINSPCIVLPAPFRHQVNTL
jgi:hypothetical protein